MIDTTPVTPNRFPPQAPSTEKPTLDSTTPSYGPSKRKRRPSPPVSESWLWREAQRYLQRYEASEARVRRLLWKRVQRAQSFHGGTRQEAQPFVEAVIQRLLDAGALNDARFAEAWIDTLRRRGNSTRMISHKLRQKGVAQEVIRESLRNEDSADAELEAALAYAKRRRLGPYRIPPDDNHPRRQKDLASMGRAGFAFDIARQILDD